MKEKNYDFRRRMDLYFLRPARDPEVRKREDEVELTPQWSIRTAGCGHPLMSRAAEDLRRFLESAMGVALARERTKKEIVLSFSAQEAPRRQCRYSIREDRLELAGNSPRGLFSGVLHLEELMRLRRAPLVKAGDFSFEILPRMRSTHSGFGLDEFPDEHLDAIAHAGFTAVDLFVSGIGRNAKGPCDINDIIERAEKYALDVVLYSYMTCFVHPDDPKADEMFDEVYGRLFRSYPKAKAIHLVGESLEFPSKDASTVSVREGTEGQDGIQPLKQMTGYYPNSDYPAYIGKIRDHVHKAAPGAEVIFNTYNWGWAPLEARRAFLSSLPKGVSLQVTYDIFRQERRHGLACPVMDYSIYAEEPGDYFTSEVKAARELGISDIRVTSNLAGATWDFGCVPYAPVPFRWIRRMEILREHLLKYGVNSFYDSHHYGWFPNVCSVLANAFFSNTPPADPESLLTEYASSEYGPSAARAVVEVWKIWSRAMDHYVASNEDQYGPWRVGPAYPFVFHPVITRTMDDKKVTFPFTRNAYRCENMVKTMYQPFENDAQSPGPLRCPAELAELAQMEKEWNGGLALLEQAFADGGYPPRREERERLLALGRFIRNMIRTTLGIKKWRLGNLRLQVAQTREELLTQLDGLAAILAAERANVLDTIPCAETDSRLGWEPRMDYVCDPEHLRWKLRQLDNAREEMDFYRRLADL